MLLGLSVNTPFRHTVDLARGVSGRHVASCRLTSSSRARANVGVCSPGIRFDRHPVDGHVTTVIDLVPIDPLVCGRTNRAHEFRPQQVALHSRWSRPSHL